MKIKNLFVNGKKSKLDKSALSDDVTSNLLPTPGSEDAGKVPTVQEDGSYALAEASGGGSAPLIVTFSGRTDNSNAACDKTWEEVEAAGMNIKLLYETAHWKYELNPIYDDYSIKGTYYVFDGDTSLQGYYEFTYISCSIDSNGAIYCTYNAQSSD